MTSASRWRPKLASSSTSNAPSQPNTRSVATGPKRIDENLKTVLIEAWRNSFTTKSDFSRDFADFVAMAASQGLITTKIGGQLYGREWNITPKGLLALDKEYGVNISEEDDG